MKKLKKIHSSHWSLDSSEEYTLDELKQNAEKYIRDYHQVFEERSVVKYTFEAKMDSMPYEDDYLSFKIHFYVEETKDEEDQREAIENAAKRVMKERERMLKSDEYKQYLELQKKFR